MQGPVRTGALDQQALVDALAAERRDGRRPSQLAVGSLALERAALRILSPTPGTLGDLLATVPNVVRDNALPADAWELRE